MQAAWQRSLNPKSEPAQSKEEEAIGINSGQRDRNAQETVGDYKTIIRVSSVKASGTNDDAI